MNNLSIFCKIYIECKYYCLCYNEVREEWKIKNILG